MAGPMAASSPAVRVLGPATQAVAVLRPQGPSGAGAPAALQHSGPSGGLRCQLSGGAGAARLGCRRADGWPLHRLAGGAAPSTWCWHAASLSATSGPSVGIWGPMVKAGEVSLPHGPRATGAEASLKCWRAAGALFPWLTGSAGPGELRAGAGGWKEKQKGQGYSLPGAGQERPEPCRQPSRSREALPSPPWARTARPCLAPSHQPRGSGGFASYRCPGQHSCRTPSCLCCSSSRSTLRGCPQQHRSCTRAVPRAWGSKRVHVCEDNVTAAWDFQVELSFLDLLL